MCRLNCIKHLSKKIICAKFTFRITIFSLKRIPYFFIYRFFIIFYEFSHRISSFREKKEKRNKFCIPQVLHSLLPFFHRHISFEKLFLAYTPCARTIGFASNHGTGGPWFLAIGWFNVRRLHRFFELTWLLGQWADRLKKSVRQKR